MANYNSDYTGAQIDSAISRANSTDVTAGTVAASKAVVVDSSKDITGFRHITATGTVTAANVSLTGNVDLGDASGDTVTITGSIDSNLIPAADDTYDIGSATYAWQDLFLEGDITLSDAGTIATTAGDLTINAGSGEIVFGNENLTTTGTIDSGTQAVTGNVTASGTVQGTVITATTGFAPDAQDGAYLGTSSLQFSDLFLADGAVVAFGDDGDVTLTHVADTGLLLTDNSGIGTTQLQFGDSGTYIYQKADGHLGLVGDTEIDISATTIDINGAVAFDGALTGITNITLSGTLSDGNYTFDTSGNVSGLGTVASGAITSSGVVTASGFTIGSAVINEAELETIDGITAGTVIASKAIVTDSNIDITGGRNITISGELDAATLDISGSADIDGTMEADAYTVDGTTLAEYIADTTGAMFSSNTESGITVTYQDGDNTVDLSVDAAQTGITSIYATDLILGEDSQTAIDFGTANEIDFKADNAARLTLTASALYPVTDNEIDLGTSSLEFKDAFFDGTVTSDAFAGPLTGDVTGTLQTAAQGNVTSLGTLTALTVDDVAINGKVITMTGSASDTAVFTAGTNGTLSIVTTDDAAAAANIQITADGTVDIDSAGVLTLDSGAAINIEPASGSAILLDGTISVDAGVVTGATSITSTTFVGNVTGTASKATVTDSTANTNFPVVFHNESDGLLDDTGALRYNPSTGELLVPKLTVAGTTTTADTVTMNASNAVIFEGATADSYETTLSIVDPTADHTQYLINQGGYIPVLAAATTTAISSTPEELNLIDGGTVRGTTAVASGDGILINDGGTMRMTNVDTVSTYFSSHNVGGGNIVTTGAINSGSITSGFGTIDTGSSAITTTGLISGGSLDIDNVLINGTTIGHTDDTDLITLTDGVVTVAGEISVTTLDIGGTNVTSTAAELNLIDGGTSRGTDAVASGDGILINDAGTMKMTNVDTVSTYFASHNVGGSNIVTTGTIATGVWNGTAIASAYLDADTAHLSGSQTFSGEKTFSANILMADDTSIGIADDAERIEFDSAGDISVLGANLGIGVSAPSEIVDIESADSTLRIASTTNGNSASIELVGRSTDGSPTENRCEILSTPAGSTANTMMSFKVENASGVLEKVRIGSGGNLMVGAGAFTEEDANGLDVSHGSITAVLGGDDSAYTRTNSTNKFCRIGMPHYTNSEEPIALIYGSVDSSNSFLHLGGATGSMNGVETITFNTASNTTTTSGTERMRINNAGNVGIGTATPESILDISNAGSTSTNALVQIESGNAALAGLKLGDTDDVDQAQIQFNNNGRTLHLYNAQTGITVDSSGLVGIGTSSPATNLHLYQDSADDWTAMTIQNGRNNTGGDGNAVIDFRIQNSDGANTSQIKVHEGGNNERYCNMIFAPSQTSGSAGDVLTLHGQYGHVGIGTGSPSTKLHVAANTAGNVATVNVDGDNGSSDGGARVSLLYNGTMKWTFGQRNQSSIGSAHALVIWDAGEDDGVYMNQGGTGFTDISDERLKTSIVPIDNAVDKLNTLQAINFKWKYGSEERQTKNNIGLLAQEVYEVFPEAVDYHDPEDFKLIDHPTIEGTKQAQEAWGIDKSKLIPVLVKAVQELSTANNELKARIEILENA